MTASTVVGLAIKSYVATLLEMCLDCCWLDESVVVKRVEY